MATMWHEAKSGEERALLESKRALSVLGTVMLIGIAGIIAYALQPSNLPQFATIASVGTMASGASLLLGILLGFLFGIPHTVPGGSEQDPQGIGYMPNTNLEQISDWLTKILVGVGLTQLTVIPNKMLQIAGYLANGLGNSDSSHTFALMIIIYFPVCGFLFGFLWTRLFLAGQLRVADLGAMAVRIAKVEKANIQIDMKVEKVNKQSDIDAKALSLAQRQLSPSADTPAPSQEELNEVIKAASPTVKVILFNQASIIRMENWRGVNEGDKEKMAGTIPIFRALIWSDTEGKFHRNHGQLGFALKDKNNPDYHEAEAELSNAIAIRDRVGDRGWEGYEFNRAICRIMQDEEFKKGNPANPNLRDSIVSDLRVAVRTLWVKRAITSVPEIEKWLAINKTTI